MQISIYVRTLNRVSWRALSFLEFEQLANFIDKLPKQTAKVCLSKCTSSSFVCLIILLSLLDVDVLDDDIGRQVEYCEMFLNSANASHLSCVPYFWQPATSNLIEHCSAACGGQCDALFSWQKLWKKVLTLDGSIKELSSRTTYFLTKSNVGKD